MVLVEAFYQTIHQPHLYFHICIHVSCGSCDLSLLSLSDVHTLFSAHESATKVVEFGFTLANFIYFWVSIVFLTSFIAASSSAVMILRFSQI